MQVKSIGDASKEKLGRAEALALAKAAHVIHIAKGKKVVTFNMKKNAPDDETLVSQLLGPTGNLRAPTIVHGKTMYVGFNADAYGALIG